jgi:hypothetical protein
MSPFRNIIGIICSLIITFTGLLIYTPAVSPGGSEFDGSTSIISIPNQAALNGTLVTTGCWSRYESLGGASASRMIKHNSHWEIRIIGTATYRFQALGWSTIGVWSFPGQALNTWAHIAASYDRSSTANVPIGYLNGIAQTVTTVTAPTGTFTTGTNPITIGNQTAANLTWDGQLAECFLYNRILGPGEIMQVKNRGPADRGIATGYWPLGVFGARNYTSTSGLVGTPTSVTVSVVSGPPLAYSPQGETP